MSKNDSSRELQTVGELPDGAYRRAAASRTERDDDTAVDFDADVSRGEASGGAWVQAWIWVPDDEAREHHNKEVS